MAVRSPLKNDSGNLKEMTSAEVDQIVDQIVYQYSLNPGVSLSVVGSGGSIGSINDTRLRAGAMSTDNSSFPNEATTEEPGTVTVAYQRISQSLASLSPTADTGKTWPAYYASSGHIQAMSLQDVKDTFLHPAIDLLTSASTGTQQGGTYTLGTSTSLAGSTLVSSTPIFVDTRADTTAYSDDAAGLGQNYDKNHSSGGNTGTNTITLNNVNDLEVGMTIFRQDNSTLPDKKNNPTFITNITGNTLTLSQNFTSNASGTYTIGGEAVDQPTTIQNYYLHKINGTNSSYTSPMFINAQNNIQEFNTTAWESLLQEWIRHTAATSSDGYKITYSLGSSGSGNTRGTAVVNTILNGTGNYQTHQVDGDDYRAQEFPNGTPTTANTYNLRIIKS